MVRATRGASNYTTSGLTDKQIYISLVGSMDIGPLSHQSLLVIILMNIKMYFYFSDGIVGS
jgi:hypothetical protein